MWWQRGLYIFNLLQLFVDVYWLSHALSLSIYFRPVTCQCTLWLNSGKILSLHFHARNGPCRSRHSNQKSSFLFACRCCSSVEFDVGMVTRIEFFFSVDLQRFLSRLVVVVIQNRLRFQSGIVSNCYYLLSGLTQAVWWSRLVRNINGMKGAVFYRVLGLVVRFVFTYVAYEALVCAKSWWVSVIGHISI